ncbi:MULTISPECIES: sensor histidine kinase [Paenibacillus]|uniref:Two-component system sensor histidine kinase YesM n=1 Tax=Paenibacillus pabuli TaxID=1472 RepID=A0A855XRG7_9BACL|nr:MULTISPECIES: sensor histidine kinase [Paenibacillus]PWW36113.1 two-component system sensor histidine kinase YesM [Paenibacillus pabuli]PXW03192.1 two-component system sensor histidine kinase YesM [Paenibacillus taichungensis]
MITTTVRFFIKNLLTFLLPMLIPLVVLGALSTFLIQQYVVHGINSNNMNMLKQTKENIELLFNEQNSLNLHIIASTTQFMNLKEMLNKPLPSAEDYQQLAVLKNFIDSPSIASPYIDSIYIYLNNNNQRYISSVTGGFIELGEDPDHLWYDSYLKHEHHEAIWTESRVVPRYNLNEEIEYADVITMYRNFKVSDDTRGVIVLNIKREYIGRRLNDLATAEGQLLAVIDQQGSVIFRNNSPYELRPEEVEEVISSKSNSIATQAPNDKALINLIHSKIYDWTFISVTPKQSLYTALNRLLRIGAVLMILAFVAALLLAFQLTKKNYLDLKIIMSILGAAEQGKPLPLHHTKGNSVYSQIIRRLLQNFIEHNYIRVQLSESQYKTQAAQFAALQSQLNPHFLYNTLETIHWKAAGYTKGPNELTSIVEHLSDILRYSLDEQNGLVPLNVEIANTKSYIAIQKTRYGERFDLWWEYDAELEKYQVLKLIFQPLIENSLQHGLSRSEQKLAVKIKIQRCDNGLRLAVIDNGDGISEERMVKLRTRLFMDSTDANHIGLINTQRRIQLAYGHRSELHIKSKPGWGTLIDITLPIS